MTRAPAPAPRTLRPVAWIMDTLAAFPRALPELHGKDEGAKGAELGYRQFGTARVLPSSIVQNPKCLTVLSPAGTTKPGNSLDRTRGATAV